MEENKNINPPKIKIVFMGSPEFSIPTLRMLVESYCVVGIITQPDRPAGRGNVLTESPVKVMAKKTGIEILQPERIKEKEAIKHIQSWQPDLFVVVAFGQILRQNILDLPRFGSINVHASLLPRWRGAAPIQAAILNGDKVTGVTIMMMDAGIDTGPIVFQREVVILPDDTAGSLAKRLAETGAESLIEILPKYLNRQIIPQAQDNTHASYAPMIKKEEGQLDFTLPADSLARRVRALNPWPGTFILYEGAYLKVHRVHTIDDNHASVGKKTIINKKPAIGTVKGWLILDEVQPASKKSMSGDVFLCGARHWCNE